MTLKSEAPGVAGTATEGKFETVRVPSIQYTLRMEWANAVVFALGEAHPDDAAAICAAFLDTVTAGTPPFPIFGDMRAEAAFWTDCAHVAELEIYFCAILNRLPKLTLGMAARKRLFVRLWETFDPKDRQAFLTRVDAEGRFLRRGAA